MRAEVPPRVKITVGLLLTLFLLPVFLLAPSDTPERKQARATFQATVSSLLKDKDRIKAREGFIEAIKQDSSYPLPRFNLGVLAEADENWEEAIKWFEEFCKLDAKSELAKKAQLELQRLHGIQKLHKTPEGKIKHQYAEALAKASLFLDAKLLNEALVAAAAAAKVDDKRWEAYALGASALSEQQLFDEAIRFIERALQRAPAEKQGQLKEALALCKREKQYDTLAQAGAKALAAKEYTKAAEQFNKAWELFPTRGEHRFFQAISLAMAGEYDKAATILTELRGSADPAVAKKARETLINLSARDAITIPTTAADRHMAAGDALAREGKWAQAETQFKEVVRLEPSNTKGLITLGSILIEQQKWAEAEEAYLALLRLIPNNARPYTDLGYVLQQQKKWAEAEVAYREAVRLEGNNHQWRTNLGWALQQQQKWAEAEVEYREAVRLAPDNDQWRINLGIALVRQGKWAAAEAEFREAARLVPDKAQWQANLGISLQQQEKWTAAETALQEAVRLDAMNVTYQTLLDQVRNKKK